MPATTTAWPVGFPAASRSATGLRSAEYSPMFAYASPAKGTLRIKIVEQPLPSSSYAYLRIS